MHLKQICDHSAKRRMCVKDIYSKVDFGPARSRDVKSKEKSYCFKYHFVFRCI